MNCPHCKEPIKGIVIKQAPTVAEFHGQNVKCVAYCCESCGATLGVESDPRERNVQLARVLDQTEAAAKTLREMQVKLHSLSQRVK